MGGCSAHNACVVLEGTPAGYDEWGPGPDRAGVGFAWEPTELLRREAEVFAGEHPVFMAQVGVGAGDVEPARWDAWSTSAGASWASTASSWPTPP